MIQREELLTIGEFSKVTGIGIHSLRYYDEIGALKPAFVDPVSNYRYYRADQLSTIPAINICKDAGISLSEFSDFIDDGKINYEKLLGYSRGAISKKIDEYRRRQEDLSKMEVYLRNGEAIKSGEKIVLSMDSFEVWTVMLGSEEKLTQMSTVSLLMMLSKSAGRYGCRISPMCYGLMDIVSDGKPAHCAFAYIIEKKEESIDNAHIVRLDAGDYYVRGINDFSMDSARSAFEEELSEQKDYTLLALNAAIDSADDPMYCAVIRV